MTSLVKGHSFHLSAHLDGVYNSRTVSSGVVTSQSAESAIVQVHESDLTGVSTSSGSLTGVPMSTKLLDDVLETTVPLFIPYDSLKEATIAASGFTTGQKGGKDSSEIAISYEQPGSARIAWIGNRKKQFYAFPSSNGGKSSVPSSLGDVVSRMAGEDSVYQKYDHLYSATHSIPSVNYTSVDVDSIKPTRVKIPKWVRPIVCTSPAPQESTGGVTVYPPGKYIVIFGFVTMRARNKANTTFEIASGATATTGWAFWLKVLIKVITYAIELAAVAGIPPESDSTPAVWTNSTNLDLDVAPLEPLRLRAATFATRNRGVYEGMSSESRSPSGKTRKSKLKIVSK